MERPKPFRQLSRNLPTLVLVVIICLLILNSSVLAGDEKFSRLPITREGWTKTFPAFRIVGNLYYVGSYDLAVFLITTKEGHILINTGVYGSAKSIKSGKTNEGVTVQVFGAKAH